MTPLCGLLLAFSKVAECALIIGRLGLVKHKNRGEREREKGKEVVDAGASTHTMVISRRWSIP